ncbi:MAG TPA: acetoacetate decarboxylase family protein [Candidatus Binataceae bacterium]|nr:acetoacetate decarboxylase family protein [Candidatus Binataceae bacterium]
MPLLGTLDIRQWTAGGAATFDPWDGDAWVLKNAELLAVSIEIQPGARALLPPGMHPSVPMYAVFSVGKFPESPVGPFTMAQVLISGRTGIRPRGFALKTLVDNEAARRELAARWGFPVAPGEARIISRHDRVQAQARASGALVLQCELTDREPIEGSDIEPLPSTNLARSAADNKLVLIQVDPAYEYSKAERGRPRVLSFDQTVWRMGGHVELNQGITAVYSQCDMALPPPRFIMDPERPSSQMPKAAP